MKYWVSPLASLDPKCILNMAILELSKRFFSSSKEISFEMATSVFEFINVDPEMRWQMYKSQSDLKSHHTSLQKGNTNIECAYKYTLYT